MKSKLPKEKIKLFGIIILVLIGVIFSSCSKVAKLAKQGSVIKKEYITEIPFKYYNDLIIVEVSINGKTYHFLFDTGAELNVISQSIANDFEYVVITRSEISGTSKSKQTLQIVEIPNIAISNIEFRNTGAIIADLTTLKKFFGCPQIDGIIGNNLLRKAIWQIDYQNETITITDDISKLEVSEKAYAIDMNANKWGNIYLDVKTNGIKSKFTFDTGYNGKVVTDKQFLNSLMTHDKELEYVTKTGVISTGLIKENKGSSHKVRVKTIEIDDIKLNNQIVSIGKNSSSLVGNVFFENYILTMDWGNDNLFLDPVGEFKGDTLTAYELIIAPNYNKNKIEISGYWDDHPLEKNVSLEAEIIEISEIDVSNFTTTELCDFWEINWQEIKKEKNIEIVISEKGEERNLTLTEKQLLPK